MGVLQDLLSIKGIRNLKNAGFYFLGSIVQSVLSLIAQPIYSTYLSAEEFGVLGYFGAIKQFFTPIFILSLTSVYLMEYFKQEEKENKKNLFNITFFLLLINTLTIIIGYIAIFFYFKKMGVDIPLNPFAYFILFALLFDNIKSIVLINFRIRRKAFNFFLFSVLNSILNVGIGLLFVAVFLWGAEGRLLAPIITSVLILPYSIYILKRYTTVYVNIRSFLSKLRVAFPLILASYAFIPIANIDRIFLERLNNLSELGLYSIGITIASYVQLAYLAIALTFEPDIFKSVADRDLKKYIKVFFYMFIPYLIGISIFIGFSGFIIDILTAGRYLGAQVYTNIAVFGVFLMGIFGFFDKTLVAMGKTRLNLFVNSIGGGASIIIMYFMINNYEFLGAAYGKVLIAAFMVIIVFIVVFRQYYKLRKIVL